MFECKSGHIDRVMALLKSDVDALQRYNYLKIVITTDPETRASKHGRSKIHNWTDIHLIYSSSSHKFIQRAEKELIEYGNKTCPDAIVNRISGGGGINNPENFKQFYLYVLVKSKRASRLADSTGRRPS